MSITWLEYAQLVKPDIIGSGIFKPCSGCPGYIYETANERGRTCPYKYVNNENCTKCWNEVIPYPVIAEAVRDGYFGFRYYAGDKFEITEVTDKADGGIRINTNCYYIPLNGDFKFYIDKDYRKGEKEMQKEFTRDDLKDGMMCEMRNGKRMLWLAGAMRDYNEWCSATEKDLLTGKYGYDEFDIVKVGYPDFDNNKTIKGALNSGFKEVIWERKEEKEISSDEAFRVLKEHYGCDVKIKEN